MSSCRLAPSGPTAQHAPAAGSPRPARRGARSPGAVPPLLPRGPGPGRAGPAEPGARGGSSGHAAPVAPAAGLGAALQTRTVVHKHSGHGAAGTGSAEPCLPWAPVGTLAFPASGLSASLSARGAGTVLKLTKGTSACALGLFSFQRMQ